MSNQPTIVLGSTSPFRKQLLQRLGLEFETASPDIDESRQANESPEHLVGRLSESKAKAVASQFDDALVIGSDQVAVIDNEILGKPGNHENAVKQLQRASGKKITFYTGLCLYNTVTHHTQIDIVPFQVRFRDRC